MLHLKLVEGETVVLQGRGGKSVQSWIFLGFVSKDETEWGPLGG